MADLATMPAIDWSATGLDALAQSVACLLATVAGTVPLARDLGVTHGIGDSQSAARARLSARIAEAFAAHLHEVKLISITWSTTESGTIRPTVTWRPA